MKFTKLAIVLVSTSLFFSACAKKKTRARVARPANTAGAAPVLPNGQPATSIPGFDDDSSKVPEKAAQVEQRPDTLGGSTSEGYTPAESIPTVTGDASQRLGTTPPKMETASESEVNGEPPNDGGNHNAECGTAYRANNEMWYPGLPYPPSTTRLCTGHGGGQVREEELYKCEAGNGYVYTDGRSDGLLAVAAENFHKLPKYLDVSSRRLARRIQDVKIETNLIKVGSVNVTVALFAGKDAQGQVRFNHIRLVGSMKKNGRAKLRAVDSGRIANYEGEITCADASGSCDNAILRLDQVIAREQEVLRPAKGANKKNQMIKERIRKRAGIGAIALVVIRNGDAHTTMSEAERRGFRSFENQAHQQFAQLMSNTVNNTCLNILADLKQGKRKSPRCAYQRLQQECGRSQYKSPGAAEFNLRSWAVVHGRSAFEFSIIDDSNRTLLKIRGPLVATNAKPMWSRPLKVIGPMAQGVKSAYLVNNDGAGNLNLQLDFNGVGQAQSRFSVTSMSHDVRFGSSEATVAQAPEVESSALAQQQDVQAEAATAQEDDQEDQPAAPAVQAPLPEPAVQHAPLNQPVDGQQAVAAPGAAAPAQQAAAPVAPPPSVDNSEATTGTTANTIPQVDEGSPNTTHTSGSFE